MRSPRDWSVTPKRLRFPCAAECFGASQQLRAQRPVRIPPRDAGRAAPSRAGPVTSMSGPVDPAAAACWLFVPGTRPDRFATASAAGADVVILDLEDSVAATEKHLARESVATHLQASRAAVRINAAGTPWHTLDLDLVAQAMPAAVLVPKADAAAVAGVVQRLAGTGVAVVALVETARAIREIDAIAGSPAVSRLAFGSLDLAVDLNCAPDASPVRHAADVLVLASASAGLPGPIDGICTDLRHAAAVTAQAAHARRRGFTGKLAIHPAQVAPIHAAFRPSEDEIEWSRRVLDADISDGVGVVDGRMVDEPVLKRARWIQRNA